MNKDVTVVLCVMTHCEQLMQGLALAMASDVNLHVYMFLLFFSFVLALCFIKIFTACDFCLIVSYNYIIFK